MKQAFLIKASVMTRVVIDVPDGFDENNEIPMDVWEKAVNVSIPRLKDNLNDFDCIEEVVPDFECPYGCGYNEDSEE
jgi:hypothetical protein